MLGELIEKSEVYHTRKVVFVNYAPVEIAG